MAKTILITGASSGIGAAVAKLGAKLQLNVIATVRRKSKLEVLKHNCNNIQIIVADVSTETGRNFIQQSIKSPIDFMLHNAAVLNSPQKLTDLTVADFRNNIVTNVEPIIFLIQKLIPHFKAAAQTARILSVSSGAAIQAIVGLGNYCISKAGALMANQVLKVEMPKYGVMVNDYFPGVVDTSMQKTLRSSSSDVFPYSDDFKGLKQQGELSDPRHVATNILDIFMNSDDPLFAQSEWFYKKHNILDKT